MIVLALIYTLLIGTHLTLCYLNLLNGSFEVFKIIDFVLLFLFGFGSLFAYLGIKKGPENFNMRFLILTTFQMLGMLSLVAALTFKKLEHLQAIVFNGITLFVILLTVQSIFLIKKVNKN